MKRSSIIFTTYLLKFEVVWTFVGLVAIDELQAQTAKEFKVKSGEVASTVIPFQDRYRFPEFREGKVIYMNGTSTAVKLNYNLLLGEMQFIGHKGDSSKWSLSHTLHSAGRMVFKTREDE